MTSNEIALFVAEALEACNIPTCSLDHFRVMLTESRDPLRMPIL